MNDHEDQVDAFRYSMATLTIKGDEDMTQTKGQVGWKSFLRSLPFTIGAAVTAQYTAKSDSTWQDYARAVVMAVIASIVKGFVATGTAQSVSVTN